MKRLLVMILLCGGLALPARAQDAGSAEALRAAQELAAIMNRDTIEQMTGALTAQIWPSIEGQLGGKVDAATLAEMRIEFERTLASFTIEVMKDSPPVYARHFNVQELRDMIAFYRSPTGAKALRLMPKVMADVGAQSAPRMQALQTELNAKIIAIMQKHGYK